MSARGAAAAADRARFRAGLAVPTAGRAPGYAQTNLIAVPADRADDVAGFCRLNPQACPVLDRGDVGATTTVLAPGADLRTDLPRYRVWRDGELVAEPTDVTAWWRDDLVAFHLGCSFTFETALAAAGVPLRHVEQGRNVPMYRTRRPCVPSGHLAGPLVVSMRPIPRDLVDTAVAVTARMPAVHGAPVHVGDPDALLLSSIDTPEYGERVDAHPGDLPVFWACGVTPQAALVASRPPFAITHAPGHMLVTDVLDVDLVEAAPVATALS